MKIGSVEDECNKRINIRKGEKKKRKKENWESGYYLFTFVFAEDTPPLRCPFIPPRALFPLTFALVVVNLLNRLLRAQTNRGVGEHFK